MNHIQWISITLLIMLSSSTILWSVSAVTSAVRKSTKESVQQQQVEELLKKHTKEDPPSTENATQVMLGIQVNSFYSINEFTMDYQLSFDLRQKWTDKRLSYVPKEERLREIKLGDGVWNQIWIPDTFFRNEKKANFHDVTVNNRMLRLNLNGTLLYVAKISATFSCPMKLQKYPLDTQECPILLESFGQTTKSMYYNWTDEERVVYLGPERQLPQFTLAGFKRFDCSQTYQAGTFPCLGVQFILRRDIGYYLIQVYVPTILIVILSWVSFWINIESSPARVSIGLLTVLTTTTMSGGARASLPRVSYIKAIDIWMIVCLIFVFASLIEYAVVNVISRRKVKKPATPQPRMSGVQPSLMPHPGSPSAAFCGGAKNSIQSSLCHCVKSDTAGGPGSPHAKPVEMDSKRRARNIDKLSRQFFPLAFVLFNVVYWAVYAIPSDSGGDDNIETD